MTGFTVEQDEYVDSLAAHGGCFNCAVEAGARLPPMAYKHQACPRHGGAPQERVILNAPTPGLRVMRWTLRVQLQEVRRWLRAALPSVEGVAVFRLGPYEYDSRDGLPAGALNVTAGDRARGPLSWAQALASNAPSPKPLPPHGPGARGALAPSNVTLHPLDLRQPDQQFWRILLTFPRGRREHVVTYDVLLRLVPGMDCWVVRETQPRRLTGASLVSATLEEGDA